MNIVKKSGLDAQRRFVKYEHRKCCGAERPSYRFIRRGLPHSGSLSNMSTRKAAVPKDRATVYKERELPADRNGRIGRPVSCLLSGGFPNRRTKSVEIDGIFFKIGRKSFIIQTVSSL